jgi:hypothetical protein
MKELRIAAYDREASPDDLPDSVRAVSALRFGLFPEGVALFRFSAQGNKDFLKNLRAAKKALTVAFTVEKTSSGESWRVKTGGCFVRMDTAHHAALMSALAQASDQGVPSTLIDGFCAAESWLQAATEIDANKLVKAEK